MAAVLFLLFVRKTIWKMGEPRSSDETSIFERKWTRVGRLVVDEVACKEQHENFQPFLELCYSFNKGATCRIYDLFQRSLSLIFHTSRSLVNFYFDFARPIFTLSLRPRIFLEAGRRETCARFRKEEEEEDTLLGVSSFSSTIRFDSIRDVARWGRRLWIVCGVGREEGEWIRYRWARLDWCIF